MRRVVSVSLLVLASSCGSADNDSHRTSSLSTENRYLNERAFVTTADGQLKIHSAGCFALPTDGNEIEASAGALGTNKSLGDLQHQMQIGKNGINLIVLIGGKPVQTKFYDEQFIEGGKSDEFVVEGNRKYTHVYWGGKCSSDFSYQPTRN